MAYDFRANQIRLNRIISSGSVPILIYPSSSAADFSGNLVPSFSTASIGTDVFFFISGSSTAKTVFGGDILTSGSFSALKGITGSVRYTDTASTPFIIGGSDVTVNYNSLGQWEISGSEANFFTSPSNGIVQTTGSLFVAGLSSSGGAQITGSLEVLGGITGSLSGTTSGNPFIVAGPNITASYNSLGQWEITGSAGGGTNNDFFFSSTANIIEGSGSLYISGALRTTTLSASIGAFITGSVVQGTGGTASGLYSHAEGYQTQATGLASHAEGSTTVASGDYSHAEGISTNATGLYSHAEGNSTYATDDGAHAEGEQTTASGRYSHAAGYNTTAAGDYSYAGGTDTEAYANNQTAIGKYNILGNSTSLFVVGDGLNIGNRHDVLRVNSGSIEVTGSLVVTQTLSASIVSASYVRANGFDITPILGQLTIGGDNTNRASGSISGLFESGSLMTPGSIGKFDVEVLAMDYNFETGASWKFTITALWPYSGNFTFIASTELAAEYGPSAGSYNPAVEWDVNFNNLGQIELTGSTPAFPMGGTSFYVQVTKKMIGGYATIIA
jgi:hypothetical protein